MGNCNGGSRDGGRGNSIAYTAPDNAVRVMEQQTILRREVYRSGMVDVESLGNGDIKLTTIRGRNTGEGSRNNPEMEYKTKGAYIDIGQGGLNGEYKDDRDITKIHGVNFDNVKSVSGDTFALKQELKQLGFKWDSAKKRWTK